MQLDQFIRDFEGAIDDVQSGSLSPESAFREIEQWDSLAVLTVIAMVNSEYGFPLKARDLKRFDTVEALYSFIASSSA
ncbi:MAG: acyl carrier protein [Opitutales bacterium]